MPYLITFLEGVVTFVSPCVLPLLPVYVAFFAGGGADAGAAGTRRALVRALGFVAGFGLLFCLMGVFAGTLGAAVERHQRVVDVACGMVMVLLGLNYMGVLHIGFLNRSVRPVVQPTSDGVWGAVLFGVVFGLGWTPCVGTFLASALGLAAASASTAYGTALIVCYVAGLGLPFVLSALLLDQLGAAFAWIKAHYAAINRVCGAVLALMGTLMLTGTMGLWLRLLTKA